MTNTATEKLLAKIRALKAKAEDPSVTEAEAGLYAAKVAELLQAHGLSESVLEESSFDINVGDERWELDGGSDVWRMSIVHAASKLYFCDGYTSSYRPKKADGTYARGTTKAWVFVGKAHNIIIAREMSEYLITTTCRLARDYQKKTGCDNDNFRQFRKACGYRIAARLNELRRQQTEPAPVRNAKGNPSNLPALYEDEATLIKNFLKSVNLRSNKRGSSAGGAGGAAGYIAGSSVNLSAQLGGKASKGNLLT